MKGILDDEMVKVYIQYLTSFIPSQKQLQYIEDHKQIINNNSYCLAIVRLALQQQNACENFYREAEKNKIIIKEACHNLGWFRIVNHRIYTQSKLFYISNYDVVILSDENNYDQDRLFLIYNRKENDLYLYSNQKKDYYLLVKEYYVAPIYREYKKSDAVYFYCFDKQKLPFNEKIEIVFQEFHVD